VDVLRFLPILHDVSKCKEVGPRVVEDAVDDHPDPVPVADTQELAEQLVRPELRVDRHVVGGVVLVVRRRLEDRIQIEGVDTEVPQIADVVDDPLDITAEVVRRRRLRSPGHDTHRVVRPVAICKSFRKDLVEHRVLHPRRDSEARFGLRGNGMPKKKRDENRLHGRGQGVRSVHISSPCRALKP